MAFLQHIYLLAVRNELDTLWIGIGFLGQAIFGVRFLIQWLRSEQVGHSVVPVAFWYCSIIGGLISFSYALHLQAWPLLIGQGMPIPIYARNLYMIYRDRNRSHRATVETVSE
ncbi:MAG TPA: lipid-A-disaccharide synthase N-terminal domain-containing protein [Rhizomicrobium sp.]|nr:lipid-A-disaccharide synthase N-terminal domain-containing protein [Rhizomicrobium sp.]